MKTRLAIGFFLLSFTLFSINGSFGQGDSTKVKLGQQVPEFEFERSPGIMQHMSDLKGKLVLITFFATWCGPCREELPHIESDIYKKYKNLTEFELLVFGREHSWDDVNKFRTDQRFTMPLYPDKNRVVYSKFAGQTIPRSFLISPEGTIIYSSIGFTEKDFTQLKKLIREQIRKLSSVTETEIPD